MSQHISKQTLYKSQSFTVFEQTKVYYDCITWVNNTDTRDRNVVYFHVYKNIAVINFYFTEIEKEVNKNRRKKHVGTTFVKIVINKDNLRTM